MFKPHVTVACVVHAQGKFLVVEETINGRQRNASSGKRRVSAPNRSTLSVCISG